MSLEVQRPDYRFFVAWIISSISMFLMSYTWHGIVLNDFIRLTYPLDLFLALSGLVYLGIGLIISCIIFVIKPLKGSVRYSMLVGGIIGIFTFAITVVLGLSFNATIEPMMMLFDAGWQLIEQGLGGAAFGIIYRITSSRLQRSTEKI